VRRRRRAEERVGPKSRGIRAARGKSEEGDKTQKSFAQSDWEGAGIGDWWREPAEEGGEEVKID
jgi:hypothetical protein